MQKKFFLIQQGRMDS